MQEKAYYFPGKAGCFQGLTTVKPALGAARLRGFPWRPPIAAEVVLPAAAPGRS